MLHIEDIKIKIKSWCDEACSIIPAHTALSLDDPRTKTSKSLIDLWWDLDRLINLACSNEETSFLAFAAADAFLERLPWLYPITLHQLEMHELEIKATMREISSLRSDLQSHDAYHQWDKIQKRIISFAKEHSMTEPEMSSLSEITPILLDAMQVPIKWMRNQWHKGEDSRESPKLYWSMPRYRYTSDFVESLSHGAPCCIAFGLIEPLVEDYEEPMMRVYGKFHELIHNTLKHSGEAGLKEVRCGHAVIGVKRGDNIWVLEQPMDYYENPYGGKGFEYYGRRASYLPLQVTFQNSDVQPGLTVRNAQAWDLRGVLDKEQVIWLPIMATAIQQHFFEGSLPECEGITVDARCLKVVGALADSHQAGLAVVEQVIERPSIFDSADADVLGNELLTILHITDESLDHIPFALSPSKIVTVEKYKEMLQQQTRRAAAYEAETRLKQVFSETEYDVRFENWGWKLAHELDKKLEITNMFRTAVKENLENIFAMLNEPSNPIHTFTKVTVNGYPSEKPNWRGGQSVESTSIDDGRPMPGDEHRPIVWEYYPITLAGKRPAVSIKLSPTNAEQVALLMGPEYNQLDWRIRFWKMSAHTSSDPVLRIENPYNKLTFTIKLAFSKREFKNKLPNLYCKYTNLK